MSNRGHDRLTAVAVKAFIKKNEPGKKLSDGRGLYLTITKGGEASWRLAYSFGGKEKTYALGLHGAGFGLAEARTARDAARALLRENKNPVNERRLERVAQRVSSEATFRVVAEAWFAEQRKGWSDVHDEKATRAFERDVYPTLGALPIHTISAPAVAELVRRITRRGVVETASRELQHMAAIFRRAMALGLYPDRENPAVVAQAMLPARPAVNPRPALLSFDELRDAIRRGERAHLSPSVRMAHLLTAFTVQRIGNVVEATWEQFALDSNEPTWTIPRAAMKVNKGRQFDHVVALGATIAAELRVWRDVTGGTGHVFKSPTGRETTITKESLDRAYSRTLGLSGKHSPHGWRAAFSTLAHEAPDGFEHDAIELALDHVHSSQVARAYDRGERRVERLRLATWWDSQLSSDTPLGERHRPSNVLPLVRPA
ncbi:MAG TPA: integrase arm-type DNA-binding domain-containing protein [Gemmatimonadaceae bacterium]|jgi:integrase